MFSVFIQTLNICNTGDLNTTCHRQGIFNNRGDVLSSFGFVLMQAVSAPCRVAYDVLSFACVMFKNQV